MTQIRHHQSHPASCFLQLASCILFPSRSALFIALLITPLLTGCAAWTNPAANGIPVRLLPDELRAEPHRDQMQTIPLTALEQEQPKVYRLAAGDVLGIFVEGVLPVTGSNQPPANPPVYFPSQIDPLSVGLQPALGFPIPVGDDGTIKLPLIDPVPVTDLTVDEANEAIRKAYLDKQILQPGRERILVTLMQPRQVRVVVIRQELGGFASGPRGALTSSAGKRGTGHIVDLRAYENDVLHALAVSGGLPGLDAFDQIVIFKGAQGNRALTEGLKNLRPGEPADELADLDVGLDTVCIPVRLPCNMPLPIGRKDIILETGDVVFIEARVIERFYTGGLLPAGEHILPRDYDLDVVEAVTLIRGSLLNGAFGGSNLSGTILNSGIGNPSPSLLTIIRRTPDGGQIPIRVDLNQALRDTRERILVQPGDLLVLQETPGEALARYVSETFHFTIFGRVFNRGDAVGTGRFTSTPLFGAGGLLP
jgi:hypothetical protein